MPKSATEWDYEIKINYLKFIDPGIIIVVQLPTV